MGKGSEGITPMGQEKKTESSERRKRRGRGTGMILLRLIEERVIVFCVYLCRQSVNLKSKSRNTSSLLKVHC